MKAKTPPSYEEVLRKKKSGYIVVRSDGCPPFRWRGKLKLALRDVDRSKEAWGVRTEVVDCATKKRLYEFRSLGAP